jgi:hypothetical protein
MMMQKDIIFVLYSFLICSCDAIVKDREGGAIEKSKPAIFMRNLNLNGMRQQTMNKTFKLAAVSSAALMLAAAPALADGHPTLKLGGYFDQKMSVANNNNDIGGVGIGADDKLDVRTDTEVYFLGSAQLDNGIKISTRVELEGFANDTTGDAGSTIDSGVANFDQIDEAFMVISGSFGAFKIGSSDTAPKGMTTGLQGLWAANQGENVTFNLDKLLSRGVGVTIRGHAAQMDLSSDAEQISYTTPKMGGLQAAVSYAPNTRESFDGFENTNSTIDSNIFSASAKYTGKAGDIGYRFGGGVTRSEEGAVNKEDDVQWMVGGAISSGPYQVSVSFNKGEEAQTNGVTTTAESDTIEVGFKMSMGASTYSLAYTHTETSSTVAATNGDEASVFVAAMRRKLGKGVSWHNTLYYLDSENGGPTLAAEGNDGFAVTTGIQVKF